MKIKKEYLILISIFLVGLLVRIFLFRNEVFIVTDAVSFSRLGKNLIESGNYVFGENYNWGGFFPPGYPLFIGIVNLFVNDLFLSTKLVSLFSSLITIFLFYIIGKEMYNKEAGLFAAFAYAVHPLILKLSVFGNAEALFFCFLFLAVYLFMVSVRRDSFFIYILLGISIAMSYLTRPEGLFLLLLPFLYLDAGNPLKNKRHLLKICVIFLTFILIISPYLLFLKDLTGKFTLSGKGNILVILAEISDNREYHDIVNAPGNPYDKRAFSLNKEKTQVKAFEKNPQASLIDFILKNPANLIGRYQKNVLQEIKILLKLLAPILLPLFFCFFYKDLFKKKLRLIFILFPVIYFTFYPLFLIMERQTLLIILFLILFSSVGFTNSKSTLSILFDFYGIKKNKVTSFLEKNIKYIIIIIFILSSLSYLQFTSYGKSPIPVEHVNAGYFLKNNISSEYEKLNIMSRKPWVSFYSGSRFTSLPYADSADVINFAKLYNVDYIVVDERVLSKWDFYDELMHLDKYSDDIELVYKDNSEKLIKLFKVKYK